jgi:hypothetical protein
MRKIDYNTKLVNVRRHGVAGVGVFLVSVTAEYNLTRTVAAISRLLPLYYTV